MDAAIKDVGAIILFVADVQRSRVFYHEVLGLDVQFEDDESQPRAAKAVGSPARRRASARIFCARRTTRCWSAPEQRFPTTRS